MIDIVTREFIPGKTTPFPPNLNAIGMTNIVTREFIPGKTTPFPPRSKCRRHDQHCNAGIHSRGNPVNKTLPAQMP
ncbi:hypothetical protein [Dyadobacter sp. 3J3]|uniref:hypothetical protein n=1 Tax=Dyadobacter sp. 3J3 TaxID=2606600 RepID=UPI00135A5C1D|nr:hypothetical protein [Dyadobacter sp. 3J3]